MRKQEKTVTTNKLQSDVSKIIKDVEAGEVYHVMRYSKPVAVLISEEEYRCLTGQCRGCVKQLVDELQVAKSKSQIPNNK